MKKQIITIVAVAVAAILLFVAYSLFFKDDGIEVVEDSFYQLTDTAKTSLSEIDEDVEIVLHGYDSVDDDWVMIYRFAEVIVNTNSGFSLSTVDDNDFAGAKVTVGSTTEEISFENFYKTLYDGTFYAFDGESVITNAVLKLCGKEALELPLRALDGYDTWGDHVTANGAAFIFPALERNKIAFLTVNNEHGTYSIIQEDNEFYFSSSRVASYDDEMFSSVTTSMRYPVAYGKMRMPEGQKWENYGLDKPENTTASYSIITTQAEDGSYTVHTVYIGDISSSGAYYYARYIGAVYKPAGKSEDLTDDEMLHNLSKDDIIYFVGVSTLEESIAVPETDLMTPVVINSITEAEDLFTIDNIRIDYYDEGISAIIKNFSTFNAADNLSSPNGSSFATPITNKLSAKSDYSSYEGGWTNNLDTFAGFTSSDGKSTYIEGALARTSPDGSYKVVFGLLRDEKNGAYLPAKVTVEKSYDGTNWHSIENGSVSTEQSDKTVKNYEVSFTDTQTVKYVRVVFDVPQIKQTYVVFDEIRVFVGDQDAQPADTISGIWKLVGPSNYITTGRNYAYLDMTNFNNFVQSIASLAGDKVVACGFTDNGDATSTLLDKEKLAKFGLDTPARHYSFVYDNVICDVYVSAPTADGKYYAYSTYTGDIDGEYQVISTDVIVELTTETADWLDWSFVEFLDHSLFSMFIADIDQIDLTVDGTKYEFAITPDEARSTITDVTYNGKSMDITSFKYLYQSMLSIYMQDEYVLEEGETGEEYLRIKLHSETNSPEIVFYRVSSTKCYFTIDGEGSYYALVEQVNKVRENVLTYVSGGTVTN